MAQEKFIPKDKRSKKEQRAMNAAKRGVWSRNPVTRTKESGKVYVRSRINRDIRKEVD